MNEKCKYCDYIYKCSRNCEYNSILCKVNRSFPKIVDISYEELKIQNQKYKEVINKLNDYIYSGFLINTKDIKDILKEVE